MGHFASFILTALARGLVAEAIRDIVQPHIATSFPAIPPTCCGWTALLIALALVELTAYAIHSCHNHK